MPGRNSPNDQIHDAVVEDLLVGVIVGDLLLLFLNLLHQLLGLDHQDAVRKEQKSLFRSDDTAVTTRVCREKYDKHLIISAAS